MKLKKLTAGFLTAAMLASFAACDTGSGSTAENTGTDGADNTGDAVTAEVTSAKPDETVQLTVYSQLANYSGKFTGWFAEILKQKFNVEITIIPDPDGTFDTRMESGNLGDIVIFGSNGDEYKRAVTEGMLFDWNEDDILSDYGPYIKENMPYAIENNAVMNEGINGEKTVYGFGHNVATSTEDHETFFYTWDLRWDLYKQLGYPEINNIDDLYNIFVQMKEINPTDDNGGETYAASLWPDWDGNMVMYVKSFATAYWGFDELGFGLYDVEDGTYHHFNEENGPYLNSLKFFNRLFQADLLDPNSMTQTFAEMSEKVTAGGTFFSIFNYSGSIPYNTEEHTAEGKYMYTVTPNDATPIAYGMNVLGGNRIWTIGANTEYPELCMEILNYISTPEGCMTYNYGPRGLTWDYDENNNAYLTEFGETAHADKKNTNMPAEWGGGTYDNGSFQVNNTTWSIDASNPDSNGETYNKDNWKSRRTGATSDIQQDWMDFTGFYNSEEYLNSKPFKVALATPYSETSRSDDLKIIWQQVAECIKNYSWQAVYAENDAEYDRIVSEMIAQCNEYDPDGQCLQWCLDEAAYRSSLEEAVR